MSRQPTVRMEPRGDVLTLVLDRPSALNAMSRAMQEDLLDALATAAAGRWRAVVLRGEGRAFCSGADLRSFVDDVDAEEARRLGLVVDVVDDDRLVDAAADLAERLAAKPPRALRALRRLVDGGLDATLDRALAAEGDAVAAAADDPAFRAALAHFRGEPATGETATQEGR